MYVLFWIWNETYWATGLLSLQCWFIVCNIVVMWRIFHGNINFRSIKCFQWIEMFTSNIQFGINTFRLWFILAVLSTWRGLFFRLTHFRSSFFNSKQQSMVFFCQTNPLTRVNILISIRNNYVATIDRKYINFTICINPAPQVVYEFTSVIKIQLTFQTSHKHSECCLLRVIFGAVDHLQNASGNLLKMRI